MKLMKTIQKQLHGKISMDILECNFFCVSSNIIKSTQELAILHLRLAKIAQMIQSYSSYHIKVFVSENLDTCFHSADQVKLLESGGD